jgi:hypothetical protein
VVDRQLNRAVVAFKGSGPKLRFADLAADTLFAETVDFDKNVNALAVDATRALALAFTRLLLLSLRVSPIGTPSARRFSPQPCAHLVVRTAVERYCAERPWDPACKVLLPPPDPCDPCKNNPLCA